MDFLDLSRFPDAQTLSAYANLALAGLTLALVIVTAIYAGLTRRILETQTRPIIVPRVVRRDDLPPRGRILIVISNVGGGAAVEVKAALHFLPFPENAPPAGRLKWAVYASVIRPGEDYVPTPNGHPQVLFVDMDSGRIDNLMSRPNELHLEGTCRDTKGKRIRINARVGVREGTAVGPAMLVERMSPTDFPDP